MGNGLLGIIPKSPFSVDVQTYFLFFAANRIRIRDITVKNKIGFHTNERARIDFLSSREVEKYMILFSSVGREHDRK